jgi:hypothetical protein
VSCSLLVLLASGAPSNGGKLLIEADAGIFCNSTCYYCYRCTALSARTAWVPTQHGFALPGGDQAAINSLSSESPIGLRIWARF